MLLSKAARETGTIDDLAQGKLNKTHSYCGDQTCNYGTASLATKPLCLPAQVFIKGDQHAL